MGIEQPALHPPMMLKLLLISALLAAATALPSPDAAVPEGALTQSQMHMSSAAKAAVSKMLETGSSDSACAELATATMAEVTDAVKAQQEAIDAFKAPNDGTACLEEGKPAVDAAKTALDKAKTDASDAAEASAAAAGAGVDMGSIPLSAYTEEGDKACVPFESSAAYHSAKAAATTAADLAASTAAAVPGAEAVLESAEAAAADAVKECECKVYTDYTAAWSTIEAHKDSHEASWTKGKHMECVLAGTAAEDCDVGTTPAVEPVTLAPGATGDACTSSPTVSPTPAPTFLSPTEAAPGCVGAVALAGLGSCSTTVSRGNIGDRFCSLAGRGHMVSYAADVTSVSGPVCYISGSNIHTGHSVLGGYGCGGHCKCLQGVKCSGDGSRL